MTYICGQAAPGSSAAGKYDLLTVLLHEMGHLFSFRPGFASDSQQFVTEDFAAAIGVESEIILPFEPELFGTAANNGQMISETDAASKSSQAIDHLACTMSGRTIEPVEKSFFKKLLGK